MTDKKKTPATKKKPLKKKKPAKQAKVAVDAKKTVAKPKEVKDFPIVCLGASAGGLKALETFLSNVPGKSGISFVVISHTDPNRTSLLPDILKRTSNVPVKNIEPGMAPEPNTVYIPPSNRDLGV